MDIKKVKVFDAYKVKNEQYYKDLGVDDVFDFHNQIVNKNGKVKLEPLAKWKKLQPIKPLEEDLVIKDKYELSEDERLTLKMLKDSTKQAKDLYDSCKRKQQKYEKILLNSIDKEFYYDEGGWECNLSPLGYCLYNYGESGEYECIFCGEPEERK